MRDLTNYGRLDQPIKLSVWRWALVQHALIRSLLKEREQMVKNLFNEGFTYPFGDS